MSKPKKLALCALLVVFFSIQLYLTLFGGFLWPFSSHRLFSQLPKMQKSIVQAILVDADGNEIVVHPGRVIPIEYSRCSGLIRNLAATGSNAQKQALLDYLLKKLNNGGWWTFDEMFAPVKSSGTAPFVQLSFETHELTFKNRPYPDSIELAHRSILFR